jgi:hypothetical protein
MSGSYEGALIANLKRNLNFSQGSEETRRVQGDLWVSPTTEHAVIVFPDDGLAWTEVGGIGKMGTIQEIEALVQSRGLAKLEGKSLDLPVDQVQEFKRLLTLDTEEINRWKHDTQAEIDFKNPGENRFDCIGRPEYRAEQAGIVIDGCKGFLCDETYKSKTYYEGDMFAYRFGIPDDRRPKRTVFPMDAAFLRKLLGQPVQNGFPVTVVASMDPNDKSGPAGFAAERYIAPEQELLYAVFFENLASATAPAQEVVISDQLDPEKMDLSTVSLGAITFGDRQVLPPPNASDWTTDVDLRPDQDLLVRIHASLNSTSGLITWQLSSIDPATGLPPEDPLVGFLPPNVNPPEGEGSVIFTLMPKQSLPTGTQMRNKATIVFDVNPPIDTPEWFNTLDNTRPASQVLPLASSQLSPTFELEWSGTDTHSGLKDYTIYVSDNNDTYTPWLASVTSTTEIFTGLPGHTYRFYSVARDNTGNIENTPDQPDATTWIMGSVYLPIILR